MSVVDAILVITSLAIFAFSILYIISTVTLITISLFEAVMMKVERGEIFTPPKRLRRPLLSLIAPAYNMEPVIVPSVRSLLASDYDPLEVIVVDDGSTDGTTAALHAAYDLVEIPVGDRLQIPTATITQYFVSRSDPRLRVLRKENGGRSDAVNAAINVAHAELLGIIDADTLLDRDALSRIVEEFARDPDNTVAVGGNIRLANGAVIEHNAVVEPRVAVGGVEATQAAEYLRSFLGSRIAWSRMNGLLIISGAFGVFQRDLLRTTGGLSKDTLGEDMELAMRLHHQLRPWQPRTRIAYVADATAWTEVPISLKSLRTQRIRWHVGLLDNLGIHKGMFGRRRFGAIGLFALPYAVAFEVIGPLLQLAGYAILVWLLVFHVASWWYALAFFLVSMLAGQLQTAGALLIEEVGFRRYRTRDLSIIAGWSLLELFWYRPLTSFWRTWATILVILGRRPGWGTIPRGTALGVNPEVKPVSTPLPR